MSDKLLGACVYTEGAIEERERLRELLGRVRPIVAARAQSCLVCMGTGARDGIGYREASIVKCEACREERAVWREIDEMLAK